jgi:lysophospholipase L1-like esterase
MDRLNLYAVGDCNTGGADALPQGESLPDQLAAMLESSGVNVNLTNLGLTMTTTREGVAKVENEVHAPDFLLINFGLVDAWVTSFPQLYVNYYPDNGVRKFGRKVLKLVKKMLRSPALNKMVSRGEVVPPEEYVDNFKQMIRIARSRNSKVKILLWGTTLSTDNPQRNENIRCYNNLLESLAQEEGVLYLDIEEIVSAIDPAESYLDNVHLTGVCFERIATKIMPMLIGDQLNR